MILAIISHTAHYKTADGDIVGWGPTVAEINHLIPAFEKIYHCAFLHEEAPPKSSLAYTSPKIKFIPLPPSGGKGVRQKLSVLSNMPKTLQVVNGILEKSDVFQFRAPTGIGLYMIPYLTILHRKKGWFKYAGNWKQPNPPLGYALQRWMLKNQPAKVTVNGSWPNQRKNIIAFDNPCLTQMDHEKGIKAVGSKNFESGLNICFVGNLTINKGIDIFMEALLYNPDKWNEVHVVGDGPLKKVYKNRCVNAIFHGFLPKEGVHQVYSRCHFVVLPSLSEGFPKVIAEGMNFGCIPIVSDVSGISQIIMDEENGFLIDPINKENLIKILKKIPNYKSHDLKKMADFNYELSSRFTFEAYLQHLKNSILQF